MAISINDRQLITQFITNTQNLNVNLPTNGGGCANLVRGIIEQATGKRISVNPFGASLESMIQKINTYHDLAKCNNGDILYFVHLPNAAVNLHQTIHYAIFCNVNNAGVQKKCYWDKWISRSFFFSHSLSWCCSICNISG